MAGRKRSSDEAKVLKGTFRSDRANPDQPEASAERPTPPDWITAAAAAIFETLVDRLEEVGVPSATHTEMLALAAVRLAEVQTHSRVIARKGSTYKTTNTRGDVAYKTRPEVALRNEAMRHAHALLAEFGLSPASAGKVKVKSKKPGKGAFDDM